MAGGPVINIVTPSVYPMFGTVCVQCGRPAACLEIYPKGRRIVHREDRTSCDVPNVASAVTRMCTDLGRTVEDQIDEPKEE
jgi:hypothetical protein